MEKHSLIYRYLEASKKGYVEPVSRGKYAQGFSLKKYLISIFTALSNWPLAKIAQKGKVSHALLRKWRCESEYKKIEEEHVRAFTSLFIDAVNGALTKWVINFEIGERMFQEILSEFGSYGQGLRMVILKEMMELTEQDPEMYLPFVNKLSMQNLVSGVKNVSKAKILAKHFNTIIRNRQLQGIQDGLEGMASRLEKRNITREELKQIAKSLRFHRVSLNDYLEEEPGDKAIRDRINKEIKERERQGQE